MFSVLVLRLVLAVAIRMLMESIIVDIMRTLEYDAHVRHFFI